MQAVIAHRYTCTSVLGDPSRLRALSSALGRPCECSFAGSRVDRIDFPKKISDASSTESISGGNDIRGASFRRLPDNGPSDSSVERRTRLTRHGLQGRQVSPRPSVAGRGRERRKIPGRNRLPYALHEVLIIEKIDLAQQHAAERLVRL